MYHKISDYGVIGDCRSCALVSSDASIDFACFPDFDSSAYFCAILDEKKGGYFKISPKGYFKSHQKYLQNTNLLETVFFNHKGRVSVTDFMPITMEDEESNGVPAYGTKIIRLVKSVKGDHDFTLTLKVTPDFAREKAVISEQDNKVVIKDSKYQLILYKKHHNVTIKEDTISVEFKLEEGVQEFFSLDFIPNVESISEFSASDLNIRLAKFYVNTQRYWRDWIAQCNYVGDYVEQVHRSALVLKLLTFLPTGAIVAAPTTSLPEKLGGEFNWDYRYTWLRDASFTVYAFLGLGYVKEAERFIKWLEKVCLKEGSTLKIMYGLRGEEHLEEKIVKSLSGYMDSKPVRVGNGASDQKQFDIFGEVLASIHLYVQAGGKLSEKEQKLVKTLVDYCCIHWREEDAGIWEPRYGNKHNTYSKLMCWVGVDRGLSIAKKFNIDGVNYRNWEETKSQIREDILKNGYNKTAKAFTIFYGSEDLDASTLNIPLHGFLPPNDDRVASTIEQIMRNLVVDWFVLRTSDRENTLQEGEGAFFITTFWLIDALSISGRVEEAKVWLDKIIHDATPLGLYAEEFDPISRQHLGNFPQAFTHLGLINSVLNLKQAEVYGKEKKPTIQSERLLKVIGSFLNKEVLPKNFLERALRFMFKRK
jgi:GH15 family glucan-1,4-alpha-glucosidase